MKRGNVTLNVPVKVYTVTPVFSAWLPVRFRTRGPLIIPSWI
jgi:hypothetical protein